MKIIVLGAGQVGSGIAAELASESNDLTVVDHKPQLLKKLQDKLDIRTVVGNASSPSTLIDAGIEYADHLLAVTSRDETKPVFSPQCWRSAWVHARRCVWSIDQATSTLHREAQLILRCLLHRSPSGHYWLIFVTTMSWSSIPFVGVPLRPSRSRYTVISEHRVWAGETSISCQCRKASTSV